ncbi:MAG TPA: hypothetical protein PLK80_06505 [bacterium]|nr:MAG: hypothetical protein BWY28_02199 [bacterium ADurb.Bin236]HPI76369.1 hypothetical protein [bacterium]HPN93706.1 hypothetical protein [bacterium]
MGYLNANHPGLAYGDGYMQGAGSMGQFVKAVGDNTFAVNTDAGVQCVGMLRKDYVDGEMPAFWCCGGVYETDVFSGAITPNELLRIDANGKLTGGGNNNNKVAQALSVSGGILKFKLLI